jgi:hypothetical protein
LIALSYPLTRNYHFTLARTKNTLAKMGQKPDFPFETTERFRGNRRSTGNSTGLLEVTVDASPHCGHDVTLLCLLTGNFMPLQGQRSVQLSVKDQLGSKNERPHSQPIPIKIKMGVANDSDESKDSMYSYDLATWRMYNRIVVHRLTYPVDWGQDVAPDVSRQASGLTTPQSWFSSSKIGKVSSCEMVDPMPIPDSNYYLEGEVFELEL